jgi:hypothetical protein
MTEGEFVSLLFDAKKREEEAYQKGPNFDWRPVIYEWQLEWVEQAMSDKVSAANFRKYAEEHYNLVTRDQITLDEMRWRMKNDLNESELFNTHYNYAQRGGKTWLGSQIEERERERLQRGNRVEEVFEVPGIRGFGYSADQAYIDEACDLTVRHHGYTDWGASQESDVALEEWLQRRSICYRASSCSVA